MGWILKAGATVLASTLACFTVADARAADLPTTKAPVTPLPMPPVTYPFYIDLSFGANWRLPASDPAGRTTFDTGFLASAAVGARFFSDFRIEGEYDLFNNKNDKLIVPTLPPPFNGPLPATGNINVDAFFLNAAYDINLSRFGLGWPIKPFVSAGIGGIQSHIYNLANSFTVVGGAFIVNSTSDWTTAYQIKAGVAVPITDRLDLFTDYRYVRGTGPSHFIINGGVSIAPTIAFNVLEFGARLNF